MAWRYNLAMLVMASFRMLHWEREREEKTPLKFSTNSVMFIPHAQCTHTPPIINTIKFGLACHSIFINILMSVQVCWNKHCPVKVGYRMGASQTSISIAYVDGQDSGTIPSEPKILMVNLQGYECFWAWSTCTSISSLLLQFSCLLLNCYTKVTSSGAARSGVKTS